MADLGSGAPDRPGRVAALATRLAALGGWRRWCVAFLSGVFATLALPPAHFLPALYIAFPVFIWMFAGVTRRAAA